MRKKIEMRRVRETEGAKRESITYLCAYSYVLPYRRLCSELCRTAHTVCFWPLATRYAGTCILVVVVYHITIVAIGHRMLKKFLPMVIGCVLRTARSSIILNYEDPLNSLELLNYYLILAMINI